MSHAYPDLFAQCPFIYHRVHSSNFQLGGIGAVRYYCFTVIYCVDFKFSFNNFMLLTTLLLAPLLALQHAGPSRLALLLDVIRSQPVADPKKCGVGIVYCNHKEFSHF